MALDERARHELLLRLREVLGPDEAATLMEMMPPVGWSDVATKRDLDALEQRVELRFQSVDHQFEVMRQELQATEHRLLASFRAELLAAVTSQTRVVVIATVGAVVSVAAIAIGV